MKKTFHLLIAALALGIVSTLFWDAPAQAASRADIARRIEEYRQFFIDFQSAPDKSIPGELLADCYGVIIVRQYKAGFGIGVKGGEGIILMHDRSTDDWYGPAFIRTADGSFGFQIGGQAIDAIILIMNQAGVDMLVKTRFTIGLDAAAAAGPVGRDFGASVGPGTALLTYSRSRGLFAGAAVEGGAMFNYDRYNHLLYGLPVGLRDILLDRIVPVPVEAGPIIETLKSYEMRTPAGGPPAFYYSTGAAEAPLQPDRYDSGTGDFGGGVPGYDAGTGVYSSDEVTPGQGGSKYDAFTPEVPESDLEAPGQDNVGPMGSGYPEGGAADPEDPYSAGGAFGGSKYDSFAGTAADMGEIGQGMGQPSAPTIIPQAYETPAVLAEPFEMPEAAPYMLPAYPPELLEQQMLDQQRFNQQAANQFELDQIAREAAAEAQRAVQAAEAARVAAASAAEAAAAAALNAGF